MPRSKEDQILYKRFRDLGNMAYQRGICVYSDFVTITQQELACQALAELYPDTHVEQLPLYAYGGYEEADRRVLMRHYMLMADMKRLIVGFLCLCHRNIWIEYLIHSFLYHVSGSRR